MVVFLYPNQGFNPPPLLWHFASISQPFPISTPVSITIETIVTGLYARSPLYWTWIIWMHGSIGQRRTLARAALGGVTCYCRVQTLGTSRHILDNFITCWPLRLACQRNSARRKHNEPETTAVLFLAISFPYKSCGIRRADKAVHRLTNV